MSMPAPECLFFMDMPDLRGLCAVTIFLKPDASARDAQIKLCRHLIFLYDQIVASPDPEEFDKITVIMTIAFYKTRNVQSVAEKKSYIIESPERVTTTQLQACLSYTLTARLAPHWNKVGHLLIQGSNFLEQSGKLEAVDMCINVTETQICICLQVQKVRLPPCELLDLNIAVGTLQRFSNNPGSVIPRHFIPSNWCYVLPSMKMGQIISISHDIPTDSPFKSYEDFQIHWNLLYGYELPSLPEEEIIYCSVYFKPIGEKLFTYPLICLRSQPIQYYPRLELAAVLKAFLSDLKSRMPHLCGFPVAISENPVYTTKELVRPLSQGNPFLVNLSQTFPSGLLSQDSRCSAEMSQKMAPMKQTSREGSPAKMCSSQPVPASIELSFHRKSGNLSRFQMTSQHSGQFSSQPLGQYNQHASASQKDTSPKVNTESAHPGIHQIVEANANPLARNIRNQSTSCSSSTNHLGNATDAMPPFQAQTSDTCELNGIKIGNTSSLLKRKKTVNNAEKERVPQKTHCFVAEVKAKDDQLDINYKKCRPQQVVKEGDVEKHASNNELYKLNNAVLYDWLKEHGISAKSRDRKEQLVTKILQFLQRL